MLIINSTQLNSTRNEIKKKTIISIISIFKTYLILNKMKTKIKIL
jgi:hypothetical protein